jgi:uncharacterized integral membrane protein
MPGMGRYSRFRMRLRGLKWVLIVGGIVLFVLLLIGLLG